MIRCAPEERAHEKADPVNRIECAQDREIAKHVPETRSGNRDKPYERDRAKKSGNAGRPAGLDREKADKNQHGDGNNIGLERRGDDVADGGREVFRERFFRALERP